MRLRLFTFLSSLAIPVCVLGQTNNYPYVLKTFAGAFPLGDGGPATSALLNEPTAAISDSVGNLYISDHLDQRIRRVTPDGNISTYLSGVVSNDMKLSSQGSLYITHSNQVIKISPSGATTIVAGNGTNGFNGDGGPAANAQLENAHGLAFDSIGNLYFTDGNKIREVTLDGNIHTIAGMETAGYSGDNGSALAAQMNGPMGVVVDKLNNVYIADSYNRVVRKVDPAGKITTFAGNGAFGGPSNGPATATALGFPVIGPGITVDSSNDVYVNCNGAAAPVMVCEISPSGNLTVVAGSLGSPYGPYADGAATGISLNALAGMNADTTDNLFLADSGTGRVVEITPNGQAHTVAGRLHYGGDGGLAIAAILNQPADIVLDGQGNAYIADYGNFRIRKVGPTGTITTYAGTGVYGASVNGAPAIQSPLQLTGPMATDSKGAVYFTQAHSTFPEQIFKITASGTIQLVAGIGSMGNSGDGGPATQATFGEITGLAIDSAGNIYIADSLFYRVRKISALDGTISPFAGTGKLGYIGDGSAAISAELNEPQGLTVDNSNNVYIADYGNSVIRMVAPNGVISTVVGNGTFGTPKDGQSAQAAFAYPQLVAVDNAGNLYTSAFGFLYKVSGGIVTQIAGGGMAAPADGIFASSLTTSTSIGGLRVDANGDLYRAGAFYTSVWKLVLDSPTGLTTSGDQQTGEMGWTLPNPLQVVVNGRAGVPVPGVTVNFAVTSGSATFSSASAVTDSTGTASVQLTLGANPGNVVVTATAAGTNLAPVLFRATTIAAPAGGGITCTISAAPSITSVNSATDFGGLSSFAPGSWLEVKGSNLAVDTRLWSGSDFLGSNAPTSLDGSRVSIDGTAGFVYYISGGQINVQAPADSATGPVKITVTTCAGTSAPVTAQEASLAPGMLAPASFNVGGKQYLVALFQDGATFVGNANLIAGVPFRPAKPGDSITAYGIGFGAVTPAIAPGVVVGQQNNIPNLTVSFGATSGSTTPATLTYAGLAPGNIGLYQFNITVPQVADGDYQINVSAGGMQAQQALYLTVHQ